jgi:heme oxygenase
VIARNDEDRCVLPEPLQERVRRLELAVAGTLAHVAGDHGRGRAEGWQEILERLDLREVGEAAEMKVGEMDDRYGRVAHAQQATRSR